MWQVEETNGLRHVTTTADLCSVEFADWYSAGETDNMPPFFQKIQKIHKPTRHGDLHAQILIYDSVYKDCIYYIFNNQFTSINKR